jgi:hypothetical protein
MRIHVKPAAAKDVLPLRTSHRQEMSCQIVHDSIHVRRGWTSSYLLDVGTSAAAFGSIAIGGPWTDKPTLFEFYVLPPFRTLAFELFETLLDASNAKFLEIQSNDELLAAMFHAYARDIQSESIVFRDHQTTAHSGGGATLRTTKSDEDVARSIAQRQGGQEWLLELNGQIVGKGGILFHYNVPYGDVYMEIDEPFRKRGLGSFLVQELKRAAYELGAVPAARCNTTNVASRRTLQGAGFVPYAHLLVGTVVHNE